MKQSIDGLTEEGIRDFCWQAGREIMRKGVLLSFKFVSFGCRGILGAKKHAQHIVSQNVRLGLLKIFLPLISIGLKK